MEEFEGLGSVPVLEGAPEAVAPQLQEHYNQRQAAVLAGAAADWKSVASWNFGVLQVRGRHTWLPDLALWVANQRGSSPACAGLP